ncbi:MULTISPECIES: MBL fold metallo-hydrolase [Telluria group]|uniref:Glyoxylase-like metal-dependent hydrolase (Beta-lactamase superfamily II) n=1 Tax=Pseudoduganella violacea TaxID=1715466 RepID=A0A7W5B986_9BURK|nr:MULTISPECIES: MBL fold metallo-hydrolase [Telluria group]AKU24509.1 beta-lactamase [Massilia sp. NR 4-1]MBB3118843.1 glyoxylase-like metal-dependent hydrolase (beta-lactamase superfamily II) [Pseudoduganella violacea]
MIKQTLAAAALATTTLAASAAAPLQLEVFNPGEAAIFPVASVLVKGQKEAVLIDAQFSRGEAQKLVEKIKASGRKLSTVYVSHGDPDFYFGLDVIKAAFPEAKIVATAGTIAAMEKKAKAKVAYWGPILGANAPQAIVMPEALQGDTIKLEGETLQIKGLDGATPDRTYVWIPSLKAVAGGVVLFKGLHVWTADTQTVESRKQWLAALDGIAALKPVTVVPGHFAVGSSFTPDSIAYTADYLRRFEAETPKAANSIELVAAMKKAYPTVGLDGALQTSAKVAKGEIKW